MRSDIEEVFLHWEENQQYLQITKEEFMKLADVHQCMEVAWVLTRRSAYDRAIAIYLDILEGELSNSKEYEYCDRYVCARELALLYFDHKHDMDNALRYCEIALQNVVGNVEERFGEQIAELWLKKLECLRLLGRTESALQEADEMIAERDTVPSPDDYLFQAYYFKAAEAKQRGDIKEALNFQKKGLTYFRFTIGGMRVVEHIWHDHKLDPGAKFNSLSACIYKYDLIY